MSEFIDRWTHGWHGMQLAYCLVQIPCWIVLARYRAGIKEWVLAPLPAIFLMLFGLVLGAVLAWLLSLVGIRQESVSLVFVAIVCVVLGRRLGASIATDRGHTSKSHRRGAVVASRTSGLRLARQRWRDARRRRAGCDAPVSLAGIPIIADEETKHFKIIGTTGTGKSTAIREMLSAALARGDRVVIADPDGGYLKHFYNAERGDVILNPFDADSAKWNLLGEVRTEQDVEQLARSLIPDGGASDKSWLGYARTFFTAVVQQVIVAGVRDDGEVYRLITKARVEELRLLLAGTTAGPFLEENNERMFGSVRAVTSSAVSALRYTTSQRGTLFSVRQWIRDGAAMKNGGKGGVLFLPYKAGEIAALRSVISGWMRIAIFEAMNRGEGDQRLWFVVDELDALGEIDGLKDALARLRKFGGRCVLGFQSISQVSHTYGKGVADTIVENCGNTLVLRCSASETGGTSQFASRLIGQQEVMHKTESRTQKSGDWLASSRTTSEQRSIEPAVMASQIERLADLQGFLKLAAEADWLCVALTYKKYRAVREEREEQGGGVGELRVGEAAAVPPLAVGAVPAEAKPELVVEKVGGKRGARKSSRRHAESGESPRMS
jgi:type IV secretory pathway TraG/TraD family ATPase VirD4